MVFTSAFKKSSIAPPGQILELLLCKVLLSVFFFFLAEWKQFPEEETWENNFSSFKKKKNPDKDRDSECRREKYQRKWAAHSNGKEETTLLFCC